MPRIMLIVLAVAGLAVLAGTAAPDQAEAATKAQMAKRITAQQQGIRSRNAQIARMKATQRELRTRLRLADREFESVWEAIGMSFEWQRPADPSPANAVRQVIAQKDQAVAAANQAVAGGVLASIAALPSASVRDALSALCARVRAGASPWRCSSSFGSYTAYDFDTLG